MNDNRVLLKVVGGTPNHSQEPLCNSCTHATIVRGRAIDEHVVECAELNYRHSRITFHVTRCNSYYNRSLPSLRSLESIAWVLRTDKDKKQIRFVPANQIDRKKRYGLSEEYD